MLTKLIQAESGDSIKIEEEPTSKKSRISGIIYFLKV